MYIVRMLLVPSPLVPNILQIPLWQISYSLSRVVCHLFRMEREQLLNILLLVCYYSLLPALFSIPCALVHGQASSHPQALTGRNG